MSRKREARLARKLAKEIRNDEKSARLRELPEDRVVRSEYAKDAGKEVRVGANPGSIYGMHVSWTCDDPDRDGQWESGTLRDWGEEAWQQDIVPKLNEFSKLTWAEVESMSSDTGHRMHHLMDTEAIADEAQYRLVEIEKENDTIYRFRLGNLPRLWGFRIVAEFQVLWYDPKHEIYPVD